MSRRGLYSTTGVGNVIDRNACTANSAGDGQRTATGVVAPSASHSQPAELRSSPQ